MLTALLLRSGSSSSDLHSLDRVDAHQGMRDVGIQPVKHRLAEAGRHARGDHRDAGADGISIAAYLPHQLLQLLDARRIRAEKRILISERRIDRIQVQSPDLAE